MIEAFEESVPAGDDLTDYDRTHIKLYMRLLDAVSDGADWQEIVAVLFGIDAAGEPERGWKIYEAHLTRARWMTQTGYKLLSDSSQS